MPKKIIIPKEIINDILLDYKTGMSVVKLAKKYPYSYDKIHSTLKEIGVEIRKNDFYSKKYKCDSEFFKDINSEQKAYWLGFIYADGYFTKKVGNKRNIYKLGITLSEVDIEHLYKFKATIKSNNPIHTYEHTSGFETENNYSRIFIDDKTIVKDLMRWGIEPNKTGSDNFPRIDKIDVKYIRHFIRGYVDGNGSIRYSKNNRCDKIYFKVGINGTEQFLNKLIEILPINYKKDLSQRHPDRDNNNYDIELTTISDICRVLDYLYDDCTVYLNRKHEKYLLLKGCDYYEG